MDNNPTILLVDDEPKFLDSISERIRLKGFKVVSVLNGEDAIHAARRMKFTLAIVDQKMTGIDGLTTITKLKELDPSLRTVLLTGYGGEKVKEAAEALDSLYFEKDEMPNFWDFIRRFSLRNGMIFIKPPAESEEKLQAVWNGLDFDMQQRGQLEIQAALQSLDRKHSTTTWKSAFTPMQSDAQRLIGETPPILELKKNIRKVASLDCTVLIMGETGTGKELVARAIHLLSVRREKRFLAVNCGSFAEDLLSNELFGHEEEAFTGALHRKSGIFEAARGGTILLDEIGDTPVSMQAKLLRVLENKTILRVGGNAEVSVDVRILAATNQSLEDKIADNKFREDFYYRLNAFTLRIPSLRDRRADIPLLSSYFLDRYRKEYDKRIIGISEDFISALDQYPFPGNVRELENAVERAVIVCEGDKLKKEHLPKRFIQPETTDEAETGELLSMAELEKQHIVKVLKSTKGNKSEAARILGISRASLWRKLREINF